MPDIHFNGKTYHDIAEMPAMERQAYEQLMAIFKDEDQDGTPDIFQGDVIGNIVNAALTSPVTVDGRQVSGLGEMTPEQRAKLEKGLSKLKEWGLISQVPDLSDRGQAPTWADAEIRPSQPIIQQPSAIQEDRGASRMLIPVLVSIALLLLGVGAFIYVYLAGGF
jgi:hypothetical protein